MKRLYIMIAAIAAMLFPQNSWGGVNFPIDITFAARGEATAVDEVTVTNLSDPSIAPVTLSGTDILRLVDPSSMPTAIESIQVVEGVTKPILTPNPSMGDGTLIFDAREAGPVRISIYTTDGKLLESATLQVEKGRNTAFIPSQSPGIYLVNIEGKGLKSTARWICGGGKSGSHIALGGAAQWANASLPFAAPWQQGVQTRLQSQANAEGTNVVRMNFHEGDILRFDGTSGQMRTLLHISPESSHDVFFDFFKCQDIDGYNYPIVRSGDMLWMMEDLRPLAMSGLVKTSSVNIWKGMDDYAAAEFVNGDRAYYTVQGARLAMPEGWEMPSIDEIYAFIKELGADSLKLGDFLKDRDADWPMMLMEGPDSIHMNLMANGYVNENGELTNDEITGAWPTRTTINHGCPATFEINAFDSHFRALVVHGKRHGFTVRGCRPAPSVYQEMLQLAFNAGSEENTAAPRRIPMQLVNTNGPLGSYYTYGSDRNSIFLDFSACQYNSSTSEQRSGVLYKHKYDGNWLFDSKNLVPLDVNGAYCNNHLRKVAAQGNADGYENVVYASWSRPLKLHFNGDHVNGEGIVNLTIFGDSTKNHSILEGYATRPLLDADGNEYQWNMPYYFMGYTLADNGNRQLYWIELGCEYYARAFNLKCIQDQTGDGVDDIVMNVGNKIAIFDGVTLRCIREREYADEGSDIGTANMRFDVADVTGDGFEDIVLLLNKNIELGYLYVYSQGQIDQEPVFTKTFGSSCLFCDVKVGNLSGHDLPEIAFLTRGIVSETKLQKTGYLYVSRLEYDENMELKEKVVLPRTSVDCFAENESRCFRVGNMDLVFGYFRGRSYNQDLVVGDGLWRYDDELQKPTYRFQIMPNVKTTNSVPADAIMAVQTREDDIESLIYIWNIPLGVDQKSSDNDSQYTTLAEFQEVWLTNDGTKVNYNNSFNTNYFGWGNVGDCYNNWKSTELSRYYRGGGYNVEIISHPVLCKFVDRERAKHFRFISHEVTFSEPCIYAAIAAAPYYKGLEGSESAQTSWGKNASDGTDTSNSDTWGGSVIMGYEHSYSAPFLSSMKAGVEFTAKVSAGATLATGHEETTTYGQSYTAMKDHVVVMHATPYDTYTYEIIGSDEPDDLGAAFIVSMPRTRRITGVKLEDYVRLTADQKGVSRPQRHLTATPGVPSSYPVNYNNYPKFVDKGHPFLQGRDINGGEIYEMVGTGGGTTRSISLATSDYDSNSVEVGVETELVATLMGVKAGVGFNYNHTNETTHTIGNEFVVSGTVPGLPSLSDPEHPQFNWNIVWYYVKDEGGVYPVINYAVTEK